MWRLAQLAACFMYAPSLLTHVVHQIAHLNTGPLEGTHYELMLEPKQDDLCDALAVLLCQNLVPQYGASEGLQPRAFDININSPTHDPPYFRRPMGRRDIASRFVVLPLFSSGLLTPKLLDRILSRSLCRPSLQLVHSLIL